MDHFDAAKEDMLSKLGEPDKSKKGGVDKDAWPFINTINDLDDYYTTSSCAGRITVFLEPASGKKHEAEWLYVTHGVAETDKALDALKTLGEETIWFRMESPIYHIACRDLDAATALLKVCQQNGWKRSGITSTGGRRARQQRVMVEIIANERIDVPVAQDGKLLVSEDYIDFLVDKGNKRLIKSREKVEALRQSIEQELGSITTE